MLLGHALSDVWWKRAIGGRALQWAKRDVARVRAATESVRYDGRGKVVSEKILADALDVEPTLRTDADDVVNGFWQAEKNT